MIRQSRTRELPFILQSKQITTTSAGDTEVTWTDGDKIWISITPMNDREILAFGGQLNEYWFKGTTKFNPRLAATKRLKRILNTEIVYYAIESVVDPIGDRMKQNLKIKKASELAAS